jgi:hypothetical protein
MRKNLKSIEQQQEIQRLQQHLAGLTSKVQAVTEEKKEDLAKFEVDTVDHEKEAIKRRLAVELEAIEKEINRRRYLAKPEDWVEDVLGETLWSKQIQIMQAVVRNRRVAVPSCFDSGKSYTAARLTAWWIAAHKPGEAFVVTTATTGSQVKAILWREIARAFSNGKLQGRLNKTEWWLPVGDREEIVAFGRKPDDLDPAAFQGIHARYVLVIYDEAAGISSNLFEAGEGLVTNNDSRILAIGNPEDNTSHFATICKPNSGWKVIRIPASATPNFTGEAISEVLSETLISKQWVEEKRISWGEESMQWESKVLAMFPSSQTDGLIPLRWIKKAQERKLAPEGVIELGVDVGAGGDKSVIMRRHGNVVRLVDRNDNPSTMVTAGNVVNALRKTGAEIAKIDTIGIGKGVVDRLTELQKANQLQKKIEGINVGSSPRVENKDDYINARAEGYWELRERFEKGLIDLPSEGKAAEELAEQLSNIKYTRTSAGKIQIESKEQMKKRGVSSPDDADAVMLAFIKPKPKKKGGVWGRKK